MMELLRTLLGLPPGASTVADEIDLLHAFVISVTMLVSLYVFAAAAWFTVKYRRRHAGQLTKRLEASYTNETLTIAGVLAMFLLWWVLGFRQYIRLTQPPADAQLVYVEAKQWMWKFSYQDGRQTNDVLTVPLHRPVKLVMSSRDVIHSFFVPAFRVKSDVVPGRTTAVWFEAKTPGRYPIWCAEYCGVGHSRMLGEVVVLGPEDYAAWQRENASHAPAPSAADCGNGPGSCSGGDLVTRGREVAIRRACVACHTIDGQRHVGPTWRGLYGSDRALADGRHVLADDAYLTRSMMDPNVDVVDGYAQIMPTYRGTLTAAEAGAVVEYIKSLALTRPGDGVPGAGVVLPALDGGAQP
ncbi:MAG: Cytochrome c oxidase polypeptide [Labilithrix sp.]|nr:Cytochrome c oxidase polypeptide [Labilithrix sp.]